MKSPLACFFSTFNQNGRKKDRKEVEQSVWDWIFSQQNAKNKTKQKKLDFCKRSTNASTILTL